MGNRSDGFEHISLPEKQDSLKLQRLLVRDLWQQNKDHPSYAAAVRLQKARRDLSTMTQLFIIQGENK